MSGMIGKPPYNVLFLCTGNSARSIMAECALNRWGLDKFRGFSAGSHPRGSVHPATMELLRLLNYDISGLRSKNWDEFRRPGSPQFDFVFTVCDQVAGEACPLWPGEPVTAHWGVSDPAAFVGSEEDTRRFFRKDVPGVGEPDKSACQFAHRHAGSARARTAGQGDRQAEGRMTIASRSDRQATGASG